MPVDIAARRLSIDPIVVGLPERLDEGGYIHSRRVQVFLVRNLKRINKLEKDLNYHPTFDGGSKEKSFRRSKTIEQVTEKGQERIDRSMTKIGVDVGKTDRGESARTDKLTVGSPPAALYTAAVDTQYRRDHLLTIGRGGSWSFKQWCDLEGVLRALRPEATFVAIVDYRVMVRPPNGVGELIPLIISIEDWSIARDREREFYLDLLDRMEREYRRPPGQPRRRFTLCG
ncbi:hypothetical protein TREMEDRAFT_62374 [Tremella mesenterica DSM 1558]|uniref:uncharacterized protein n=1 Tax=Tremella mesenterica (strain ATCC 24925 / CBS 8224 / DSM 1558 / NBRC 9311 / NRRL Y-6157 / RJB 2259-6 / UBC 559-6) TaxID=578456 RepID=UPI0003F4A02E|nr:uncharacterized protein TREMEDRAFT_62374 [Tremella mesenterica DSM 1558]EIW69516.1 hypothetical protein TREMEDRAFT_62374 [Tremella mesenterica DSM 1558]